jgi:DNA invertase Pin-like site-specific DNA recombinase
MFHDVKPTPDLTLTEYSMRPQDHGADLESLAGLIDTNTPTGRLVLQMLGAFAGFER